MRPVQVPPPLAHDAALPDAQDVTPSTQHSLPVQCSLAPLHEPAVPSVQIPLPV